MPELAVEEFIAEVDRLGTRFDSFGEHEMILGTHLPYAATHQYGSPSRKIPQREFMAVTPAVVENCQEIVSEAINQEQSPIDALKACREPIFKGISANFTASESAAGEEWPLRKYHGTTREPLPGHPLLILSGSLYLSSTSSFGPDHIEEIS